MVTSQCYRNVVYFSEEDGWRDAGDTKNVRKCAAAGEGGEKDSQYAQIHTLNCHPV